MFLTREEGPIDLQERIRQAQETKKQDIHGRGDNHDRGVIVEKPPVLAQPVRNQPEADQVQEVQVETQIRDEEECLLRLFEEFVQGDLLGSSTVQVSRDPDDIDGDVDESDDDEEAPFQDLGFALASHDQRDTICNDLRKKLHLNCP